MSASGALRPRALRRLQRRDPLPVDPRRGFALKRNVHEWTVAAPAAAFAEAFQAVMREPGRPFGPIRLGRSPDRLGAPFAPGERFHGCFALALFAEAWGSRLLAALARTAVAAWFEDTFLSDYAEIVTLDLVPDAGGVRRVVYRYLSGSPVKGSTTLEIAPLSASRCRFRAAMTFQEAGAGALWPLHAFGLRAHDEVVRVQVESAAARLGAPVLDSTIRGIPARPR